MAKKKKDQDQVKKNRGKGEQPPVTPNTAPEGIQPPEAATPKVNDEEMVAGLRHAFENGQLTLGQVLQRLEDGGLAAEVALEMIGTLVAEHNRSVAERKRLTPTPPPNPTPTPTPSPSATSALQAGAPNKDKDASPQAIRDQMSRAEPRGDDGGIVVTTVRVPSGFALADLKANALKEVARLIATL
ncbi:MAG: hypothetical protein EOL92_07985 [Bacteroidia bacterium]|nr:hypothetical protein [Bacteroidia bacterium]